MSLKQVMIDFLKGRKGCVATLQEIYTGIDESDYESNSETVHDSARCVLYRNPEVFERKCKGVYMLKGEKSTSLIINGDGRKMDEIENKSIDCIITDHPWEDKKAHRSGNQKAFAEYDVFRYMLDDFKQKARVLKDGAYLVEFLPVESATNWEYLHEIKQMAKQCGLNYYTHCIWRNAPEGTINTGKTTKGVQQLVIFSKGKPRKLSRPGIAGYQTKEILNYEIEMLLKAKDKCHQAEKPVALYEYLIRNLTEEHDICLDQFGGSCNMAVAAVNLNRFAIVYELCKDFVKKAAERYGFIPLYSDDEVATEVKTEKKAVSFEQFANMFSLDSDGQFSLAV
jgi:site-specific DNA-methyltransferase (adenine-specific)